MSEAIQNVTQNVTQNVIVESIHLAETSGSPMREVTSAVAEENLGLVGDRHHGAPLRQVTVQAVGELADASAACDLYIDPALTRRNITISADAVPQEIGHRWKIGAVELEVTKESAPCALMNEIFGEGAKEGMMTRGGVGNRVVKGGEIQVGDSVDFGTFAP